MKTLILGIVAGATVAAKPSGQAPEATLPAADATPDPQKPARRWGE